LNAILSLPCGVPGVQQNPCNIAKSLFVKTEKIQLLHPEGKNAPAISMETYKIFERAMIAVLKENQPITYTDIARGVKGEFKKNKVEFAGSVSWYSVCVKNHLEATGIMETYMEKGKKMHGLKKIA
jgi:hypothetical protein